MNQPSRTKVIQATKEFFGEGFDDKQVIKRVVLWLMNKRKGLKPLSEEEREAILCVRRNLKDELEDEETRP